MKKIKQGFILPSSACTVPRRRIAAVVPADRPPQIGDLVYGTVQYIGQHSSLENCQGRIHAIHDGTRAVFVYGNRYAPDYYEGLVPRAARAEVDLLARSGLIGEVVCKSSKVKDPTRIRVAGYVVDADGRALNTRDFCRIQPKKTRKTKSRARMILNIGTSMNSGKSTAAAACCWALSTMGHTVRGTKVTGTASLKDILLMEDNGAAPVADFSFLGFPSTYLLSREDLLHIFNSLDLKYANCPKNYWVVEIADGILQRETAMLLESEDLRRRVHRVIFSAHDAFGAIGGLRLLKERFDLVPDAISGVCSGSPLGIRELREYTDIPLFDSVNRDLKQIAGILL